MDLPGLPDEKSRSARRAALLALVLAAASACASLDRGRPEESQPVAGRELVDDRLFLGRRLPGGGEVPEEAWGAFVQEVITPRFPEGFTVWRAEGQWRSPGGEPVSEPVMVLEVLHPGGAEAEAALEAIAREYKRRFQQDAVLRATAPARVRLY